MKKLGMLTVFGMALAFTGSQAFALGVAAKAKAGKVQGNLVPAYSPQDTGSGTGDDENDSPALQDVAVQRSPCTFLQGKFKQQLGKDSAVQLKGVECGGTPVTGQLCAHTKQLATIMNEEIDKTGASAAKTCTSGMVSIEGKINYSTGNIGLITCTAGTCKGTLQVVTADPCPDVDKVSELRRFEVFDGPDKASIVTLGTTLAACCGPGQTTVGGIGVGGVAPCNTSTQDVLGEMGTITQGVAP
jgi:hypothetical protein